jgi:biopolymer transport protein ExbD
MLGVTLCLLITLMMNTTPQHGTYIDRYRSRNATLMPAALREDALRIMLTRDGTMYFGNSKVANEDLPDQIRQRIQNGAPAKVYLVVDSRTKYGDVSAVLDEVRDAGIWNVAFLAESTVMHR